MNSDLSLPLPLPQALTLTVHIRQLFLSQLLSDDQTCLPAVARLLAWRVARGLPACSPDTGGYCKARQRLPETLLPRLAREAADGLQGNAPEAWLFHGRRVVLADGSTVSMPDTPENQAEYPQHSAQKPGCGFPIARIVVLIALATGCVLDAAIGAGKLMSDQLYGVRPWDPIMLTMATLLLGMAALLASLIPARRAAGVEPMVALRNE